MFIEQDSGAIEMQATVKSDNQTKAPRFTITGLSDAARLPRRTVQYWYDHGIVTETDFELTRMLVPFVYMQLKIETLKTLGKVLRQTVLEHEYQTSHEADHFLPHVKAARAGKPAVLGIQFIPRPNTDELYTFSIRAGRTVRALAEWQEQCLDQQTRCPLVLINLTEALQHGVEATGTIEAQRAEEPAHGDDDDPPAGYAKPRTVRA